MNNMFFSKSFAFRIISHQKCIHTDNSGGLDKNYVARMTSGSGLIAELNGNELKISKGDVFFLPMGIRYHSYWTPCNESGRVEWESYGFTYFPDVDDRHFCAQIIDTDKDADALLDTIKSDMTISPRSVGAFYSFLGRVIPSMECVGLDENSFLFQKATEFIENKTCFKVSELAKECGMSESALYSFFKSYSGQTPTEVKNRLRIKKAVALLGSTDMSVEEISSFLGFGTVAYFRKVFSGIMGKTPTEVRKEQFKKYNL